MAGWRNLFDVYSTNTVNAYALGSSTGNVPMTKGHTNSLLVAGNTYLITVGNDGTVSISLGTGTLPTTMPYYIGTVPFELQVLTPITATCRYVNLVCKLSQVGGVTTLPYCAYYTPTYTPIQISAVDSSGLCSPNPVPPGVIVATDSFDFWQSANGGQSLGYNSASVILSFLPQIQSAFWQDISNCVES